jgi:hypothetical protein
MITKMEDQTKKEKEGEPPHFTAHSRQYKVHTGHNEQ